MKKLLFSLMLSATMAFGGADIILTWSNNPPNEFIEKYIVYQATGTTSTNYVAVVTAVATNFAKIHVTSTANTYKFKVQAVNGMGVSALSTNVQIPTVAPSQPGGLSQPVVQ
jgi:hypothetical protein